MDHTYYEKESSFLSGAFFALNLLCSADVPWGSLFLQDVEALLRVFAEDEASERARFPWYEDLLHEESCLEQTRSAKTNPPQGTFSLEMPLLAMELKKRLDGESDPQKLHLLRALFFRALRFYASLVLDVSVDPENGDLLEKQKRFDGEMTRLILATLYPPKQ